MSEPATFLVSDNEVCVGEPIILQATDLLGTNTEWNFGFDASPNSIDAYTNNLGEIKQGVTYTQAGTKTITYQDGTTSLTENVTVRPLPISSQLSITNTSSLSVIDEAEMITRTGYAADYPVIATAKGDKNNMYYGRNSEVVNPATTPSPPPASSIIKRKIHDEIVWSYQLDGIHEINKIQYDDNGGVYVFAQAFVPSNLPVQMIFRGANQTITRQVENPLSSISTPTNFVLKYDTNGNLLYVLQTSFRQFEATKNGFYLNS